jgi:hypothetical protein
MSDGKEISASGVDAKSVHARVCANAEYRPKAAVARHDSPSAAHGGRQGEST